jgi:hypothetical protein
MKNFVFLSLLTGLLLGCNQQNSTAPKEITTEKVQIQQSEPPLNFLGFSPCLATSREDLTKTFENNEATKVETTIDKRFETTSIKGKIGKGTQSFELLATIWNEKLISFSISNYHPSFIEKINKDFGNSVDSFTEIKGSYDIKRVVYKNPNKDISLTMSTLKSWGSDSTFFEFSCLPLEIEYKNSLKSK